MICDDCRRGYGGNWKTNNRGDTPTYISHAKFSLSNLDLTNEICYNTSKDKQ